MSKYIKEVHKGQIIFIIFIVLAIIAGLVWNYVAPEPEYNWKPVKVYPMANAEISWLQTYHGGGWNE